MTLSRASCRTTGRPTTRSPGSMATASATPVRLARVRLDRVDDFRVAGAAAEVALERTTDLVARRRRMSLEERERRQQHPRRAEATLHGAVTKKRVLERMELTVALETAHGHDRPRAHGRG